MSKKILLISYGGGHVRMLDLVFERLLGEKNFDVRFIGLTSAYPYLSEKYESRLIPRISSYSHLFDDEIDSIYAHGLRLLKENYNPDLNISKQDTLFYLGVSYHDLEKRTSIHEAYEAYATRKRQAFYPVSVLKRILLYENPDLVITTNSPRFEAASIEACHELNIPTLQLLDLFGNSFPVPNADHIVVLNEAVAKKLKSEGNLHSKFYPFGQPIFDETVKCVRDINAAAKRKELGIDDKKTLLFCPPNGYVIFNDDISIKEIRDAHVITAPVFEVFDRLIAKYAVNILIRPHPSQPIEVYTPYFAGKKGYCHFNNAKLNLFESLAVADAIVTYNSTVAVQAVINQKIVFTYNCDAGQKYHWPELMQLPFTYAPNLSIMESNLEKYLAGEVPAVPQIGKFYTSGAVNNIVSLIKDLV